MKKNSVDFDKLVNQKWVQLNIDQVWDTEVKSVIASFKDDSRGWWNPNWSLLITGWYPPRAEALAEDVVSQVLTSHAFTEALNELANELAVALAGEIEIMSARSASSMLLCLQAYVGTAYSDTLYVSFVERTAVQVDPETLTETELMSPEGVLEAHSLGISGVGVLVLTGVSRQIIQSMGKALSRRIVGNVVTRIIGRAGASVVPYAGWILGLGLIAYDLITGASGALPQIERNLLDEDVKIAIRQDIAEVLETGLADEIDGIATRLADGLMIEWTTFCLTRRALCQLAGSNSGYRNILANTPINELDKLNIITQTYLEVFGRTLLDQAIMNGDFFRLTSVPPDAIPIFAATASLDTAIEWVAVSEKINIPNSLQKISETGVHRFFSPTDLAVSELATIITIEDNDILARLLELDANKLSTLLSLIPDIYLVDILGRTSVDEVDWLIGFLPTLNDSDRETHLVGLATSTIVVADLQNAGQTSELPAEAVIRSENVNSIPIEMSIESDIEEALPIHPLAWALSFNSILFVSMILFVGVVSLAAFIAIRRNSDADLE